MEYKPTLAKLIASLDHKYVKEVAEYLILLVDNGTYEQNVILPKPFGAKIAKMADMYDSELRYKGKPTIRITKACYTTEKHLPGTLRKLLPRLQN